MLRLLVVVTAAIVALLIGLRGPIVESSVFALLGIGAMVWAVTLGTLVLDAGRTSA